VSRGLVRVISSRNILELVSRLRVNCVSEVRLERCLSCANLQDLA